MRSLVALEIIGGVFLLTEGLAHALFVVVLGLPSTVGRQMIFLSSFLSFAAAGLFFLSAYEIIRRKRRGWIRSLIAALISLGACGVGLYLTRAIYLNGAIIVLSALVIYLLSRSQIKAVLQPSNTAKYRKIAGEEHREWYERLWNQIT